MNINMVAISGNLTRDPELRTVGDNVVANLRIATAKGVKRDGEWSDVPMFFDVTVWGRMGELCDQYLSKGSHIVIGGRLDWRQWENDAGEKRSAVSIVADKVEFPPKRDSEPRKRQDDDPARDPVFEEVAAAFPNSTVLPAPDSDDDIPFDLGSSLLAA